MALGKIVILNGGSSAGKTSLAHAFQSIADETYLHLGIDLFWFSLPKKQWNLDQVDPQYYSWVVEEHDGKPMFRILPGPILDDVMIARYWAIAAYLKRGFNVIADDVIWKRLWLQECLKALEPYDTFFVHVYCTDEVSAQRETARGDRHDGWARGSAFYTKIDVEHDFAIDTSIDSPDVCAQKLKSSLERGLQSAAASRMRQSLVSGSADGYG